MNKRVFHFIAARLRELRGDSSQGDFAARIGIPFRTYQRYESGERMPKTDALERIARVTGRSAEWILTGEVHLLADRAAEEAALYGGDPTIHELLQLLKSMTPGEREEILKLTKKEMLLWSLMKKKKEE